MFRVIHPVLAALCGVLAFGFSAHAGDILRGGTAIGTGKRTAKGGSAPGADAAAKTQANARDRLSRTTQTLDAVKAMQAAARAAAAGRPRLTDPNHPGKRLPLVLNGLGKGGLELAPGVPQNLKKPGKGEDPSLWVGANLPRQTSGKGGDTDVTIVQTEQQALLNWTTFNIGKKTTLTFDQSAGGADRTKWVAFNKVNDPTGRPSQILGSIKADGQVYVINQNGIIFGGTSQVNVHTLVASALPINDNLIARGLINNPDEEFLFDASRVENLLDRVSDTTPSVALGQTLDDRSLTIVQATDKSGAQTVTLTPRIDYTITTGADRKSVLTLTPAGLARVAALGNAQASFTVAYTALAGNVVVEAGARLQSPTSPEKVGGRVMLVGASVENKGTITTPDGQTILAAGLQVGIDAHDSGDPAIRGLDVYVGSVFDPLLQSRKYAGTATNSGLVEASHANVTITGEAVRQLGTIESETSVALNGSVSLLANYGAVPNLGFDPAKSLNGPPFAYQFTGEVTLGKGSVIRILPELDSADTVIGTSLALRSQVDIQGHVVHLDDDSILLAPNAKVGIRAGAWNLVVSGADKVSKSTFYGTSGQIYAEAGAILDVAGTTGVETPLAQNILTLQLRGAELSNSPLQRTGVLRGPELTLDIRDSGTYNGFDWVGTPLADATGYVNLIEHSVAELTMAGGSVDLQAGGSIVLQRGSTIDVSGGWQKYGSGYVETTRVVSGGRLIDIADATPDLVYDGLYTAQFTQVHQKWGIAKTFRNPLALSGRHFESEYIRGRDAGSISLTAPSMALDGRLAGNTTAGSRQMRNGSHRTELPVPGRLALTFKASDATPRVGATAPLDFSPLPPKIVFTRHPDQAAADPFGLADLFGALPLRKDRAKLVLLSPDLLGTDGFGFLAIDNKDGRIVVPADITLDAPARVLDSGSLKLDDSLATLANVSFQAANIDIRGRIVAPGGILDFTAYDFSPYDLGVLQLDPQSPAYVTPAADPRRGNFFLRSGAVLDTSGLVIDDRPSAARPDTDPVATRGGSVTIQSYNAFLRAGSVIDVSGGAVMSAKGAVGFGDAGSITLNAGRDPNPLLTSLLGGKLRLDGTLEGYSGAAGGSLAIQAPGIRIGAGAVSNDREIAFSPDFFDRGGFASFAFTGLGSRPFRPDPFASGATLAPEEAFRSIADNRVSSGLVIEPGTIISPAVQSWRALPLDPGSDGLTLELARLPEGLRSPLSLRFGARGATDDFTKERLFRGDLLIGEGVDVRAGPRGSVTLAADTISVLGAIRAPGGAIVVKGADAFPEVNADTPPLHARTTVYLGPESRLSTAGTVLLTPNDFGHRTGSVLGGGTISVSGNIVAMAGSTIDVSGASGILDLTPAQLGLDAFLGGAVSAAPTVPVTSGLTGPLTSRLVVPTRIDSDGGSITLAGGEQLFVDADLKGAAGGPTALGGSLDVSSHAFVPTGVITEPKDVNLVVTQDGDRVGADFPGGRKSGVGMLVRNADGKVIPGRGYFAADRFLAGGFDSLSLGGVVRFRGPVSIDAAQKLSVAAGGVLYADDAVDLTAPYVVLGTPFQPPLSPLDPGLVSAFNLGGLPYYLRPRHGDGSLTVHARLIDVGNLSLQNIGVARLIADGGDIRGDGTLDIAGRLYLRAGQIYPATGVNFTLAASDYREADTLANGPADEGGLLPLHRGSVVIAGSGDRQLPLSAGGSLHVYGSRITQGGTLRAPFGSITIGWDGSGDRPADLLSGAQSVRVTRNLTLVAGSETSVSGADSGRGGELVVPYGIVANGTSWIDPAGTDITSGANVPAKDVRLGAVELTTQPGSLIDLRGGGNLYAYRWVTGQGGTRDILASAGSFAVIPGYEPEFAPAAGFNTSAAANLLGGDPGYANESLRVGDRVALGASAGLAAGTYTLLPARYALLPGAVLVTPRRGAPVGTLALPDGSSLVSGYRFNGLNDARTLPAVYTQFEVAPASVVRARAQYDDFFANRFLRQSARLLGTDVPLLPIDSGHLVFQAGEKLVLSGAVRALAPQGGIGAAIDISSPADILIVGSGSPGRRPKGTLVLNANVLTGFGAESLLVGGIRNRTDAGTIVDVITGNLTVDNAGSPLSGPEVILAARRNLTLAAGSEIRQDGIMRGDAEALAISGNGALLRVSADPSASVVRTDVTPSSDVRMTIARGAQIAGTSLVLDSSFATDLDPRVRLQADYVSLNSGQISLRLSGAGDLQPTEGLVLAGSALRDLQGVKSLSLLSYTSIDIYGHGDLTVDGPLALHGAEIRGFDAAGGGVTFHAGDITLDNAARATRPGAAGPAAGTLTFDAETIQLGRGRIDVDQYAGVELRASGHVFLRGSGRFSAGGAADLAITTPYLDAEGSSRHRIVAGGALRLLSGGEAAAPPARPGLGASLALEGASVVANSAIYLPSGQLDIRAESGDVTVGGRLDVGGSAQALRDLVKYTGGGRITLAADAGSVVLAKGGELNVAAQAGGGDAGAITIDAARGRFDAAGEFFGQAGKDGLGGSFQLDVARLPETRALNAALDTAGFSESRTFRVRQGDVTVNGTATARIFNLSADQGDITVSGLVDGSGERGGAIRLVASGDLVLLDGARLTVAAKEFDAAGKGGSILLEAGSAVDGVFDRTARLDIRSGSTLDLRVAARNAGSEARGQFTGTLHLRAPQDAAAGNADVQIDPVRGSILGASKIVVEGYQIFDLSFVGGVITGGSVTATTVTQPEGGIIRSSSVNIQESVRLSGVNFGNGADAMTARLFAGANADLAGRVVIAPGAEIINQSVYAPISVTLGVSGSSSVNVPAAGGTILFPEGTAGNNQINSTRAGTIVTADGRTLALAANTPTALPAGSSLVLTASASISFVSGGTGGPISLRLTPGSTYTSSAANTVATVGNRGTTVSLNSAGNSSVSLAAGTSVFFTVGTPGTRRITSTVDGTILTADGQTLALAANTPTSIPSGSTVTLGAAGRLAYAAGGSGVGVPTLALLAGSFSTGGPVAITPPGGDLTLGTLTSPGSSDWNLNTARFGPKAAPGVLTLRASGNLVFLNALQDGFDIGDPSSAYTAGLLAPNPLLPANAQSWSFRLASGADFSAADFHRVQAANRLVAGKGSILLGKNANAATASPTGSTAQTSQVVGNRYQVIRTGSGDIDIVAGRDLQLLNPFATVYTAGTRLSDDAATMGGKFDLPVVANLATGTSQLGSFQQANPHVEYSLAGGNVSIAAQGDIVHLTRDVAGNLVADSGRELPINWLYRRGYVDPATGEFGSTLVETPDATEGIATVSSTTWWVDFANFFEGVGALGGGNVSLVAGHDIRNVDAVIPTNARMPKGRPDDSKLVELGGGDLVVRAGHDIDAGVYYVERGRGTLDAGNAIRTNETRLLFTPSGTDPVVEAAELPTTLFLGKGRFDIRARGDILLGPVANPFLLPGGINNGYWYKSYFSTYSPDAAVDVASLGGSVTLRQSSVQDLTGNSDVPLLWAWMKNMLLWTPNDTGGAADKQPWLRLNETSVLPFQTAASLLPPTLRATAFSGDINLVGDLTLAPAARGTLELAARGSLNGLQANGLTKVGDVLSVTSASSRINVSDASPAAIPAPASPFAYQELGLANATNQRTGTDFLVFFDRLFAESGSVNEVVQTKQALHATGLLHRDDPNPLRLYTVTGDISGLTLFSPKSARILAGTDINDISFYLQNVADTDVSVVSAGRDIVAYNANAPLRAAALADGNVLNLGEEPLPGDIQISGPGALQVLAGRNLDLGTGAILPALTALDDPSYGAVRGILDQAALLSANGIGVGIVSVGNARNPALGFEGASVAVGAGIGGSNGLTDSRLDFAGFVDGFLATGAGADALSEALGLSGQAGGSPAQAAIDLFDGMPAESQTGILLDAFAIALRNAGRDHNLAGSPGFGNYDSGFAAIASLFGERRFKGDISTRSRDIRTKAGGALNVFAPGGKLILASSTTGSTATPPGIVTEAGGNVNVFTDGDVDIGIGRIFTLRGGNIVIWSSTGDIAAGSSAKTVASAPPTRVLVDPQSADLKTDLAGLSTGGGIGVLATVEGVEPGDVDLIAPTGVVDAGDAGIRATGNLNIAAVAVLNASNISVGGISAGVPSAAAPAAPNIAGLTAGNSSAGAANNAANDITNQARQQAETEPPPSDITVEVIGYGGGDESASTAPAGGGA